ncbi:glutathione S-transferase [Rickenella mellea]|uniref:glutathione transferase n=1 Tax=Rickenella mellea TaxID=50990 RepID=A0A4Y7PPX8_9AGAM|nr:glutathione S-transferase [Rickenella mellea]
MVLKLIGARMSINTRRVAVVCKELKLPYELVPVDMANAEHKSPAYLEKQPFGQVPIIDDDGFNLFESRAICRYLVRKYGKGSTLIPSDLHKQALFEAAASVEQNNFEPYRAAELQKAFAVKLKGYEAVLGKHKYLAGEEITIADLFHLPYGNFITDRLQIDSLTSIESTPMVARWWDDITSRPSWQAVKDGA